MNVYIPDAVKKRMDSYSNVNWSATATAAFEARLDELDKARRSRVSEDVLDRQAIKEALVMKIDGTMEWRQQKAQEYSDDTRNTRCADALAEALPVVADLDLNHPLFVKYAKLTDDELNDWVGRESEILARFGFDSKEEPESLVDELVGELERILMEREEPE